MRKKLLGLFFALVLCALILPAAAFAEDNYLTFTAQGVDSSVTFNYGTGTAEYSTDGGTNWTACPSGTTINLGTDGTVKFRGTNVTTHDESFTDFRHFSMTGSIAASGDVTSLTNGIGGDAMLTEMCYANMFSGCSALTTAPDLPATTLAESCYSAMFSGCSALTTAPALSATKLVGSCYEAMFDGCTKLTVPADLSGVQEVAKFCCHSMYHNCISLTAAPTLSATKLAYGCYWEMFKGCTALKVPADLSDVTELAKICCSNMYNGCTSMKVYASSQSDYAKAWKATNAAVAAENWSNNMFANTSGDFKGAPTAGQTYYVKGEAKPEITEGGESSYQKGSSEGLTFRSDADIGYFSSVKVDGTEIASSNYDLKKGSTIVTLKPAYLDTLSAGVHQIEIVSETGTAKANFTITVASPVITEGGGSSYQKGSSEGLTFRSDANFDDFISVKVDGTVIDASNYDRKEGSTIVTLKAAYLDTLSAGEHQIEIVSTTGTAEAKFTITAVANNSPATGVTGNDTGLILALLACAGAVVLMAARKYNAE